MPPRVPSPPQVPTTGPSATLEEIRALMLELPGPDLEAATACTSRDSQLTKPAGSLGRLEEIAVWLCAWQGRHPPSVDHPRTAVFAGNHGVVARGVSAFPQAVTAQMVQNFVDGGAAVNQLCQILDADLRVYELDLDNPTSDFTTGPAMDESDCARAIAYGMMAVEPGIDLICLGEMGIGNTTSAAALCLGLYGGSAEDWTGPGTGVSGEALAKKRRAVAEGVRCNRWGDAFSLLACVGGLELAAIIGAIIAARLARIPVLLDGFACTAAAAVLHTIDSRALDHCQVAHLSAEPAHRLLCEKIAKRPLLDLGMRLGEGSGATLAACLVRAAAACHTGMATFGEAGVANRSH
jgi:nicotinate-nucleotide--dimethylbenzimidazole phosphoribosyltransferase